MRTETRGGQKILDNERKEKKKESKKYREEKKRTNGK